MKKLSFSTQIKVLAIGGMTQAGSTLCFNICRLLCEKAGEFVGVIGQEKQEFVYIFDNPNHSAARIICKQHNLDYDSPWRSPFQSFKKGAPAKMVLAPIGDLRDTLVEFQAVNVIRDIRDCVASYIRKKEYKVTGEEFFQYLQNNYRYSKHWEAIADFVWIYEVYKSDPVRVIGELAILLELELTHEQVLQVHQEAESLHTKLVPNDFTSSLYCATKMDLSQQTNGGKIGDYHNTLTEKQINLIEEVYEHWLYSHRYIPWTVE